MIDGFSEKLLMSFSNESERDCFFEILLYISLIYLKSGERWSTITYLYIIVKAGEQGNLD